MKDQLLSSYPEFIPVVRSLSMCRSLEDVMKIVRCKARELVRADGATFVLREGDFCFYADEDAVSPLWKGLRFPIESCVSGIAMLSKTMVVIEDIYKDPRVPIDLYKKTFVKSLVMVPIRTANPLGAIGTYWAELHQPSKEELEILQALADIVAVTLDNVQMYSALQVRLEELDNLNRAKDEFLTVLSHELRTPLNSILGWTKLLREEETQDLGEYKTGLQSIEKNAELQLQIVEDLLDVSRIVTGRFYIEKHPLDLGKSLQKAVEAVKPQALVKNISFDLQLSPYSNIISGDENKIEQIIFRILQNAVKFSPEGTEVVVCLDREQGFSRVEITDQGEGIDPNILPLIFGLFRQADGSSRRRHGGLGLGLAIVRHLVEAHGGQIRVTSDGLGKGSTFSIYFPVAAVGLQDKGEINKAKEKVLEGLQILAVDDCRDAVELLQSILIKKGADVKTAESAKEAFHSLDHFHPDLLVCDLSMPEEDGFSLIKRIRSGGSRVPAIALTAFADKRSEIQALSSGFDSFMTKPVSPSFLIKTAYSLVQERRI